MSAAPSPQTSSPTNAVSTPAPRILAKAGARYPAGPSTLRRLLTGQFFRQATIAGLAQNARLYGDLVHIRAPEGHAWQFNHPALIQELIVDLERRNRRVLTMQRARSVLGDGLITSEEPLHMRQRRLVAPAFHRQRIAAYGEVIGRVAQQVSSTWQPGTHDVHPDMLLLALRITGKCLFDLSDEAEVRRITQVVQIFLGPPPPVWLPVGLLEVARKLPLPPIRRIQNALDNFDRTLYAMIEDRRRNPGDRGDLLSMLMASEDSEAPAPRDGKPGTRMTDKQVRDECFTIMLAGHETTANALSFTLWLLAKHPEIQECGHREAVAVLSRQVSATAASSATSEPSRHQADETSPHQAVSSKAATSNQNECQASPSTQPASQPTEDPLPSTGTPHAAASADLYRIATAEDYPHLTYIYGIFAEAMRLLPTVWVFGRSCGPEPYDFHGFTIRPGDTLIAPQIVVHRDPRFWPDPDRFDPTRFLPPEPGAPKPTRPRFAYFPFGGGSRQCIGESLAWMEGVLTLATILRDWRLSLPPGAPDPLPLSASINLRPKQGVPLVLERR